MTAAFSGTMALEGDRIVLRFPYRPDLIARARVIGLTSRKDHSNGWSWHLPTTATLAALDLLRNFLAEHRFQADSPESAKALAALFWEREQLAADSRAAAAAALTIPGFAGTLRPFQAAGVAYAARVKRCLITDEQGLGKSWQALALCEHLGAYPAAFVVPASLRLNWMKFAEKLLPGRRFDLLMGASQPVERADAYVMSYEALSVESFQEEGKKRKTHRLTGCAGALKALGLRSVVFDEVHYAKNPKSIRSIGAELLAEGVEVRLGLTGTPFLNRPEEIIHPLRVLGWLQALGGFMSFAVRYCGAVKKKIGKGKTAWDFSGATNLEELNQRLRASCMVRRLKAEVIPELPPIERSVVWLPLANEAEYRAAEKDFILWLRANAGTEAAKKAAKAEAITRINTLKRLVVRGKLPAIKGWVEDGFLSQRKKLALFAHHREAQEDLSQAFPVPLAVAIRGGDSPAATEAAKELFCGSVDLIVCSLKAGGVGHTLHADGKCSTTAAAELGWTPADMAQLEARVHRIGQTAERIQSFWLVAAGTIDEDIMALLEAKEMVVKAATDGSAKSVFGMEESVEDDLLARLLMK